MTRPGVFVYDATCIDGVVIKVTIDGRPAGTWRKENYQPDGTWTEAWDEPENAPPRPEPKMPAFFARLLRLERLAHQLHNAAELPDDAEHGIVRCDCSPEAKVTP